MEAAFRELLERLNEISSLNETTALLYWDQATYMPAGGARSRARQIATLSRLAHARLVDPQIGRLLEQLRPYEEQQGYDSFAAGVIRVTRRDYERLTRVPESFVAEFAGHTAESYTAWISARPANDFAAVQPYLEKTLELSRQMAEYFPGHAHIADALIDFADEGMTVELLRGLFGQLRNELVPLVQAIAAQPLLDDSCIKQHFPVAQQNDFGMLMITRFGYDFQRGRLDKTHHPFMTKFGLGDVRITTRFQENDLSDSLFSTLHEAGHALYEQGINMEFDGTPLASGVSAGVHESQSRLWENMVGRSRGCWEYFYPQLQAAFPEQLGQVPLENYYRAINRVAPSLIRTDADEVTYNLHVMLRFDFEIQLLEGQLAVRDLPEAWRERYRSDLGVTPPDDRDGVLQDTHWFSGPVGGAFQGYTLGNLLSAQFYEAALRAHPEIPAQIAAGEFGTLHQWLRERIYQFGRLYSVPQLIERATGSALSIEPYLRYLRGKYAELYQY